MRVHMNTIACYLLYGIVIHSIFIFSYNKYIHIFFPSVQSKLTRIYKWIVILCRVIEYFRNVQLWQISHLQQLSWTIQFYYYSDAFFFSFLVYAKNKRNKFASFGPFSILVVTTTSPSSGFAYGLILIVLCIRMPFISSCFLFCSTIMYLCVHCTSTHTPITLRRIMACAYNDWGNRRTRSQVLFCLNGHLWNPYLDMAKETRTIFVYQLLSKYTSDVYEKVQCGFW